MSNKDFKGIKKKVESLKPQNETKKRFFNWFRDLTFFIFLWLDCDCNEFWKFFKNGTQLINFAAF